MKIVELTQGKIAYVDDEDYQRVIDYGPWVFNRYDGYAQTSYQGLCVKLHRFIMGHWTLDEYDHRNGYKLDCQKSSLRIATTSQNQQNKKGRKILKGICWRPRKNKWTATINVDGLNQHLGYFNTDIEAARAYDVAALQHYGEFARLNFS